MTERFFVRTTADTRKALLHLAIDLNTSHERLAGRLLAAAVIQAAADYKAGKLKPEERK